MAANGAEASAARYNGSEGAAPAYVDTDFQAAMELLREHQATNTKEREISMHEREAAMQERQTREQAMLEREANLERERESLRERERKREAAHSNLAAVGSSFVSASARFRPSPPLQAPRRARTPILSNRRALQAHVRGARIRRRPLSFLATYYVEYSSAG